MRLCVCARKSLYCSRLLGSNLLFTCFLRPEQRFLDEVHKDKTEEIHRWKIILKRDNSSDDQVCLSSSYFYSHPSLWNFLYNWHWLYSLSILNCSLFSPFQTRLHPLQEKQSKSMEEREEEYQRVRDRIFNQEVRQIETEKEEDRQADIGDSLISLYFHSHSAPKRAPMQKPGNLACSVFSPCAFSAYYI